MQKATSLRFRTTLRFQIKIVFYFIAMLADFGEIINI